MADAIWRAALTFAKSGSVAGLDTGDLEFNTVGTKALRTRQTVGTSAEALGLGEISAPGATFIIRNLDLTNFVSLKPNSSGVSTVIIRPGGVAMGVFASGVTAPHVQADTGSVDIEYVLVSA